MTRTIRLGDAIWQEAEGLNDVLGPAEEKAEDLIYRKFGDRRGLVKL